MKKILLFLFFSAPPIYGAIDLGREVEIDISENKRQLEKIQFVGSLSLPNIKLGGHTMHSLSGLGWDNDNQHLYALSDRGKVFVFRVKFKADGKPLKLRWLKTIVLKNKKGKHLHKKAYWDSEGIDILNGNNGNKNDTKMIISFERKHRIWLFSDAGRYIKNYRLAPKYRKGKHFRKGNNGLEAVTFHPQFGVISAPEYAKGKKKYIEIFSLAGKKWRIPATRNMAITGMDTMPDGSLLILSRNYANILTPMLISLRRLEINTSGKVKKIETLATLDGANQWYLDNFEGLTHIRDNLYCMVSDDNHNSFQRTLLSCFKTL